MKSMTLKGDAFRRLSALILTFVLAFILCGRASGADSASGAMKTGWVQVNGKWYYFYSSGAMAAGTAIDGYTLGSDGAME